MKKAENVTPVDKGFLARHRRGTGVAFHPAGRGFLRVEHRHDQLFDIAYVLKESDREFPVGRCLEFRGDTVTFIERCAVSGTQWCKGEVAWGHTYEGSVPGAARKISLEDWVDECIALMVRG